MREIKFRAWYRYARRMAAVKLMFLTTQPNISLQLVDGDPLQYLAVNENVDLMQFTGLKDKDGKEIYDGDIVHISWAFDEFKARVFWGKSRPLNSWDSGETWILHFIGLPDEREGPLFPYCDNPRGHEIRVIGNIYENEDLLK